MMMSAQTKTISIIEKSFALSEHLKRLNKERTICRLLLFQEPKSSSSVLIYFPWFTSSSFALAMGIMGIIMGIEILGTKNANKLFNLYYFQVIGLSSILQF